MKIQKAGKGSDERVREDSHIQQMGRAVEVTEESARWRREFCDGCRSRGVLVCERKFQKRTGTGREHQEAEGGSQGRLKVGEGSHGRKVGV